jgi:hypothetical protein
MRPTFLWLSLGGMAALWVAAYVSAVYRSRVGASAAFLVGTLIAWPALTIGLGAEMFDVTFPPEEGKPVGSGGAMIFLVAGTVALLTWLVGLWMARTAGWLVRRRRQGP